MTTTTEITTADISALLDEAQTHRDTEMADICTAALAGDASAIAECERVIRDVRAMDPDRY